MSKGQRSITIQGATGSIGCSMLKLVRLHRERFDVMALSAHSNGRKLARLAIEFDAKLAVIADPGQYDILKSALAGTGVEAACGAKALVEAAALNADYTMAAITGFSGLAPTLAAVERGGIVALANKEALVSAGPLFMNAVKRTGATLLPVDSEHNAIFQCLQDNPLKSVHRIILTASGGPFRTLGLDEMRYVTPEQAIAHPNWSMGRKISVDSATMMNKGLELIEAKYLFPVSDNVFEVLIHPQSVVHSLVEFVDKSVLAQMGTADMQIPIAYTLGWPERISTECDPIDLATLGALNFEAPSEKKFPALALARRAMEAGGAMPAVLNGANEEAVNAFLNGRCRFLDITKIVNMVIDKYTPQSPQNIDELTLIDMEARRIAREYLQILVT